MMVEWTSTQWRYRGSAVLFKSKLLAGLLAEPDVVTVSLREALSWVAAMPAAIPTGSRGTAARTILIGGLDPILEQMTVKEAEDFLRGHCRKLISIAQDHWADVGIVFGTNIAPESAKVDHQDHVLLRKEDGATTLRLSSSLWNGSAGRDLAELRVTAEARSAGIVEGYYVRRLS